MKNVINIVNFIRGWDQRADFDLKESVVEQARLAEEYNLPVTFLYQYDAMVQPEYINILKDCKAETEFGIWIECSRVLIESVGLKWRGREGFEWDWHSCVDMTVGYTTDERKLIIDEIMRCFKDIFGYYPKTVGSWALDAYSIKYMKEKYNIDAALICKEQWGTDGYSLWGGYNSSAYYPCVNNIFCPAQNRGEQINVPVFRMLGGDPVDQYMSGIGTEIQTVESMEPVYGCSGADRNWVEWYLKETFNDRSLGLNYCQAGQENSFGWAAMKDGYSMQMQLFNQKRNLGEIDFELVSETARKYKETYSMTPVRTEEAHKENSSTIWYNSKYYRSNLYYSDNQIMLRDIFVFNEEYRERYFDTVTVDENLYFDNLPLIDCFRWSKEGEIGGGYFKKDGRVVKAVKDFTVHKIDDSSVYAEIETEGGVIRLTYNEKSIAFDFPSDGYTLETVIYKGKNPAMGFENDKILCRYCDFDYSAVLSDAVCKIGENGFAIIPDKKSFEIKLCSKDEMDNNVKVGEKMKFELNEYHRNTSDEELIEDLIRVAKLLKKDSVTIDDYNQYGKFHATTLTRRFKSWFSCLDKAGLHMSRSKINISDEELFEELENVWTRLGKQPSYSQMRDISKFSVGTYEKRFNGWRNALNAFINYINEDANTEELNNKKSDNSDNQDNYSCHKTSRTINLRTRFIVFSRDNFKCCACGASPAKDPAVELQVDHIVPWSKGGETVVDNLQTLCSKCNVGKSDIL